MSNMKKSSSAKLSKTTLDQGALSDQELQSIHAAELKKHDEGLEDKKGISLLFVFVLLILYIVVLKGGDYIVNFSSRFDSMAYNETKEADRGPKGVGGDAVVAQIDPLVLGKRLYAQNCVVCHQATGQGVAGAFPPLNGSEYVVGSEQRPIRILLNGLSGPITVNGTEFNSVMPAFGPMWDDEKIAAVLTYIRSEWGNQAEAVLTETVEAVRAVVPDRGMQTWTVEELEAYK
jgi:mono/diheme cytochrome c family protein